MATGYLNLYLLIPNIPTHTHTHTHTHTAAQSPTQPSAAKPKALTQEDTPTIQRRPSNPPTPPPVVYSPSTDVAKNSNITSPQLLPNGESSQSSQESSSSQMSSLDTVLCFASTIDGNARVPSTGSDVRDRCRDLLIKALKKGFNEGMSVI